MQTVCHEKHVNIIQLEGGTWNDRGGDGRDSFMLETREQNKIVTHKMVMTRAWKFRHYKSSK